jgi:hypothetical protein
VKYYRDVFGLKLVKEDKRVACLRFGEAPTEIILHCDEDLPSEAIYYLVDDVRAIFDRRAELKVQFVQHPNPGARGYRAAIRDPFGNIILIVDRTAASLEEGVIEDAKPPGALFAGIAERTPVKPDELIEAYERIGRTADDLPYTPDFEKLHGIYCSRQGEKKPTRQETWRHLLNLRKAGKLPRLGEARSRQPDVKEGDKAKLRALLGDAIGRRDRLPYSNEFDRVVDDFNRTQSRPLSPHLVWRMVATLAK